MTQAVTVRGENRVAVIDRELEARRDSLMAVMPDNLSFDRFRRVVTVALSKNPDLAACTPTSIITAVYEAAQLGLEPTGALGRAYLVPYKDQAQLQIGYLGLMELARRSGVIRSGEARIVWEGDSFRVRMGTDKSIEHEPAFATSDPEDIVLVYAIVWFHTGEWDYEVMPRKEIDGIRARSRSGNRGPWVTDYGEMARKTVLRRLLKRQPLTVEILEAITRDDEREYAAPVVTAPDAGRERIMAKLRPAVPAASEPAVESAPPVGGLTASPSPEPAEKPVAEPPAEEVIEGEAVAEESAPVQTDAAETRTDGRKLCGTASPYGDGLTCELVQKHLGLHRADHGKASWQR